MLNHLRELKISLSLSLSFLFFFFILFYYYYFFVLVLPIDGIFRMDFVGVKVDLIQCNWFDDWRCHGDPNLFLPSSNQLKSGWLDSIRIFQMHQLIMFFELISLLWTRVSLNVAIINAVTENRSVCYWIQFGWYWINLMGEKYFTTWNRFDVSNWISYFKIELISVKNI